MVGLIREIIVSALFGTSASMSAFSIAFNIPNVLRSLVADSALSAALIPAYTRLMEEGRTRDAQRLLGAMVGLISLGLGGITLLAILFAPWYMPLFAPGLAPEYQDKAVGLAQLMFPIVPLLGLTGLVAAVLQSRGRFGATGFVPVLWNLVIIACLVVIAPTFPADERLSVYAVGIVLGTVAQLVYLWVHLGGGLGFSWRWFTPEVRTVLVMMLPVTLGLGMINVNAAVDNVFATLVSDEAVRAIETAFRLYILPQGVFSVAVSTVLFPAIARMVARNDMRGVGETVGQGTRQIFFMLLPASAFLMVLAEPITRLVFERGAFDARSTSLSAAALFTFTIGLAFNGASLLVIRAFFSLQDPWGPTRVAALGLVLNAVLDMALLGMGISGIPLATSLTSIITFAVLVRMLQNRVHSISVPDMVEGFLTSLGCALVMALLSWTTWRLLDDALGRSLLGQVASVGAALIAGSAAFVAAAHAIDQPELKALARLRRPLP